jgi:hypothetical protein
MREHALTPNTLLYRHTLPEFLDFDPATATSGRVSAAPNAGEALVDIYGQGHVVVAAHVGPGLALAPDASEWESPDRHLIGVRLGDVIDQGGRLYPVESVITSTVWFASLPAGSVAAQLGA